MPKDIVYEHSKDLYESEERKKHEIKSYLSNLVVYLTLCFGILSFIISIILNDKLYLIPDSSIVVQNMHIILIVTFVLSIILVGVTLIAFTYAALRGNEYAYLAEPSTQKEYIDMLKQVYTSPDDLEREFLDYQIETYFMVTQINDKLNKKRQKYILITQNLLSLLLMTLIINIAVLIPAKIIHDLQENKNACDAGNCIDKHKDEMSADRQIESKKSDCYTRCD